MTVEIAAIDKIDREILGILSKDARIPYQALGDRVNLSANACADRVRRLIRNGVIKRFTIDIDQARLGRTLEAIIDLRVDDAERFKRAAVGNDEVTYVAHVTGSFDYHMLVACAGTTGLNELLNWFKTEGGVRETCTTVILEQLGHEPDSTS